MESATGQHLPNVKGEASIPLGRADVARDAGLTEALQKQAMRLGRISETEFATLMAGDKLPENETNITFSEHSHARP